MCQNVCRMNCANVLCGFYRLKLTNYFTHFAMANHPVYPWKIGLFSSLWSCLLFMKFYVFISFHFNPTTPIALHLWILLKTEIEIFAISFFCYKSIQILKIYYNSHKGLVSINFSTVLFFIQKNHIIQSCQS